MCFCARYTLPKRFRFAPEAAMSHDDSRPYSRIPAVILSVTLLLGLLIAVGVVLRPFVMPLLWSGILVTATWPAYCRFRAALRGRDTIAALILTLLLGLVLLVVTVPLPLELAWELQEVGHGLAELKAEDIAHALSDVPLIGSLLAEQVTELLRAEGGIAALVASHQSEIVRFASSAVRGLLETLALAFLTLGGCFVLYMHGETLVSQIRAVLRKLEGPRVDAICDTIGATVRGAAYSVVATAIAQGTLAGIGFSLAGAPLPVLLALSTMVLSLLPFGSPLLYVPVSAYLLFFTGRPWYHGVGLLVWGFGVISTVDNFLRSILISQATQASMVLVFIGVVGGVMAFGLLGVFIGPALMSVAQTLWRDFAADRGPQPAPSA